MSNDPSVTARLLTPERCARLREVFDHALELASERRAAWIAEHVADGDDRAALALLLQATTGEGPLDRSPIERMHRLDDDAQLTNGLIGQRVGAFRLRWLLGQGGMATVFLGERDDAEFHQVAAVKLLRVGLYSAQAQRAFRRERQALAALSHPHIAHLIDGGISDAGVPYLVLEYVDGLPITQHATQHGLDREARLRLFVTTCLAVAAAHRQLIVHRDLKPSNILVTAAGEVKLLDFGIAKLLDDEDAGTRSTRAAMTPEYAAPEQFDGGPVTTATDVFALGIVLHELMLGYRPATSASRAGHERASQPRPATADAVTTLRGDLATVLAKALAPEPERRYDSAAALAEDVEHFLAARPVRAHPPSRWYRARTFVRRHRGGVALGLAFAIGVLASLALAVWQAGEARREAAHARAEAQRARSTRAFIEDLFQPVQDQLAEERMPSLRELVDGGARRIDAQPELGDAQRIDLLLMFSRLQAQLSETTAALALAERAWRDARRTQPPDSPLRIAATQALARARLRAEDHEGAAPLLREVERWQATHAADAADRIDLYADLAWLANEAGRPASALPYAERELALRIEVHGADSESAGAGYNNLGYVLEAMGRLDAAIEAYRKAVAIDDRRLDPGSLQRAFAIGNLAQALFNAGRLSEAKAQFSRSLALYRDVAFEQPPRSLLGQHAVLADTELALGELDGARGVIEEYARLTAKTPPDGVDHAIVARLQARLALERGDLAQVAQRLDALQPLIDALPAPRNRYSAGYRDLLRTELALFARDDAAAAALAQAGASAIGEAFYPLHVVPHAQAVRALACARSPRADCPDDAFARAGGLLAQAPFDNHPALLFAGVALARVELQRGDADAALARLDALLAAADAQKIAAGAPRHAQVRAWRAVAAAATGDCDAARADLRTAQAARGDAASPHPFVLEAEHELAAIGRCAPGAAPTSGDAAAPR